jgi:esterase
VILSSSFYPPASSVPDSVLPVVILHGLFGSGRNWHSMAGRLSHLAPVWTFDLRNHGDSDHHAVFTYPAMVDDIVDTCRSLGIDQARFIGHSMGGKCAMLLTLREPELVASLVVADIGPGRYPNRFTPLTDALLKLDLEEMKSRGDADTMLSASIPDRRVRQFLLHNLQRHSSGGFYWGIGLQEIAASLDRVGEAVTEETDRREGKALPVLFIAGEASDYLDEEQQALALQLFPGARFATVPKAGHWLHADNPDAFFNIVKNEITT